jgi:hypothetical protein
MSKMVYRPCSEMDIHKDTVVVCVLAANGCEGESHNQIRDLFETADLKLSSVASNLLGLAARSIIEAVIGGEDSP